MKKIALAALMLAAAAAPSQGAGYDDLNVAISHFNQGRFDDAISWFDKAIAAGDLIPDLMRVAHLDRGLAYERKGDAEKAHADFTAAIAAQPTDMLAYRERIAIYLANNRIEMALADYEQLNRLRPNSYQILASIGRLNWQLNRMEASAKAFSYFADADPYTWLWLQLTNIRLGKPLMDYPDTFETRNWPHHLPRFYLGRISEASVMEAGRASSGNPVCAASLFTGLWHVVHNEQGQAAPLLEAASKSCNQGSELGLVARSELDKIASQGASK
jgi:tetratricopeptide (TPR) repeat protein